MNKLAQIGQNIMQYGATDTNSNTNSGERYHGNISPGAGSNVSSRSGHKNIRFSPRMDEWSVLARL